MFLFLLAQTQPLPPFVTVTFQFCSRSISHFLTIICYCFFNLIYTIFRYQALNENAPDYVNTIFAELVPGFHTQSIIHPQYTGSIFHDSSVQHPVTPSELLPILPPSSGEKAPDHPSKFYLEALLESMVHTVVKLEWQDRSAFHHRCFSFLLEKFKIYYLPKICPNFGYEMSLYKPNLGNNCSCVFILIHLCNFSLEKFVEPLVQILLFFYKQIVMQCLI